LSFMKPATCSARPISCTLLTIVAPALRVATELAAGLALMAERGVVVGFAGLGAIGTPMAERLVEAGEDVVVYNRTGMKTARFRGRARIAATPAAMADEADVVIACLTTAQSYREVVLGPSGLIRGSRLKTYVHAGTD